MNYEELVNQHTKEGLWPVSDSLHQRICDNKSKRSSSKDNTAFRSRKKFKEAVSKFKENRFSLLSQLRERERKICVCIRNRVSHLCFFAPKLYRELIRHTAGVSNDRSVMCISRIRKMFKNTEYLSSLIKF